MFPTRRIIEQVKLTTGYDLEDKTFANAVYLWCIVACLWV